MRATMTRGTGRSFSDKPGAEPRLEQLVRFLRRKTPGHRAIPGVRAHGLDGRAHVALEIAARRGPHLDRHFARNVGLPFGRGGAHQQHRAGGHRGQERHDRHDRDQRAPGDRSARHDRREVARAAAAAGRCRSRAPAALRCGISIIDMQPPLMQHHAPRRILIHQRDVVGRDDDGGAGLVEFDEQPQQPPRQCRIDVAGRLVGQQQLRPAITARAIAARCFSPPDRTGGSASMRSPRPTQCSRSMTSLR